MSDSRGRSRRRLHAAVAAALCLIVAAGCTRGSAPEDGQDPPADIVASEPTVRDASDLRVAVERALGHHSLLTMESMRAVIEDDRNPNASRRWIDLAGADLLSILEELDAEAVDEVAEQWDVFRDLTLHYANALDSDDDERDSAGEEMTHAAEELGAALSATTRGAWEADAAEDTLREHAGALRRYAHAHAEGDYDAALTEAREEYARMVGVGQAWAEGLAQRFGDAMDGSAGGGPAELRSAANQLLGEHAALTSAAVRRVASRSADYDATIAAVNGNTEDLTTAMSSVFDDDTADEIAPIWRRRIDLFVTDGVAAADGDDRTRERIARRLERNGEQLTDAFASALDGELDANAVQAALDAHAEATRRHTTAHIDGRLRRAGRLAEAAYRHAGALADLLAGAIAEHDPERYPG